MGTRTIFVVAAGAALACGPQPETPAQAEARMAEESAAARTAVEEVLGRWARYMSTGLRDSMSLLFTDDVRLLPPNTAAVSGHAAVESFFGMMADVGTFDVDVSVMAVDAHGPIAYVAGAYTVAFTPGPSFPGATAASDTGKYLAVLRQVDSHWLIAAQSWNTDLPIRTPMTASQ